MSTRNFSLPDHLDLIATAPGGIQKLRGLILELAVRGKLVPQDAADEPAGELLKRIAETRARLEAEGKIKQTKPLLPVSEGEKVFPIPKGWEWVPFGQATYCRDSERIPVSQDERNLREKLYDYYGASGVIDRIDGYLFEKPLLLIGEDGANLLNRSTPIAFIARGRYWVNNHAHVIDGLSEQFLRYMALYINAIDLRPYVTGTAQPKMNQAKMNGIPVALPPLAEQHRIVAKVDELMALCARLATEQADADAAHARIIETLLDTLTQSADANEFAANWQRLAEHFDSLFVTDAGIEALKQTILQLAVMGKLVPQDAADEPAGELLKRVTSERAALATEGRGKSLKHLPAVENDDQAFALSAGWEWTRLGELVLNSGAGWSPSCEPRPRQGDEWGVLKVSAVSWGEFKPDENKALPENLAPRPEHEVAIGDFLISRANTAELVARSVVVESCPDRLMLSDKIVRLKLSQFVDGRFINITNACAQARDYYARVAGGTSSSMKNVSREQILNLVVPLPPLAEQHRIVAKVDELMALCDRLEADLIDARTRQARLADTLIDAALTAA